MHDFIERTLYLMKINGISAYKLTKELGFSPSFFTDHKTGKSKGISLDSAMKIADYFDVSIDWLTYGTEDDRNVPSINPLPPVDPATQKTIEKMLTLKPIQKKMVDAYVDGLKASN